MKNIGIILIAVSLVSSAQAQSPLPVDSPSTLACKNMLGASIGRELDAMAQVSVLQTELTKVKAELEEAKKVKVSEDIKKKP